MMFCSNNRPFSPMSSKRPRNGLMNAAPAFAATIACAGEKHKVTFTLIPSSVNCRVALRPSRVSGHLTTTFGAIFAYSSPSRTMPSLSWLVTSAETGPWTISQIAAMCFLKSTSPSFAISDGFVVTPSASPSDAPSRISFKFAVSRKNFIARLLSCGIHNLVAENADPVHFYFDCIAVLHAGNARGRSGRNQVARIQCHDLRDVSYKKGDRECHVSRVAFLFHFAVQTRLDCNIGRIDVSLNPRTHRTKRVKRFATRELNVFAL